MAEDFCNLDRVSAKEFVSDEFRRANAEAFDLYLEYRAHCECAPTAFSMAFRRMTRAESRQYRSGAQFCRDMEKVRAIEQSSMFIAALATRAEQIPVSELWDEEIAVQSLFAIISDPEATGADCAGAMAELDVLRPEWRYDLAAALRPREGCRNRLLELIVKR